MLARFILRWSRIDPEGEGQAAMVGQGLFVKGCQQCQYDVHRRYHDVVVCCQCGQAQGFAFCSVLLHVP